MPIYEFECPKCGVIERVFSVQDMPRSVKCDCGKRAVKILPTGVASIGNLTGHHPPVESKIEKTARFQNKTYFDRPDIADKIRTGEMTVNVPKGTPDRLLPNVLKEKK